MIHPKHIDFSILIMATTDTEKSRRKAMAWMFIQEIGGATTCARLAGLEPPTVIAWRNNGIPRAWEKYFRLARPLLKTWKAFPEEKTDI